MRGNFQVRTGGDRLLRGVEGASGGVALGCAGEIDRGLRQRVATFRQSNALNGGRGGGCNRQPVRIGVADVLGGQNHQSPCNELRRLAGLQHLGEPEQRGVRIGSADALDKGGDGVVVVVTGAVVADAPLEHGLTNGVGVYGGLAEHRGVQGGGLGPIQRGPSVAAGARDDGVDGGWIEGEPGLPETAIVVRDGPLHDGSQVVA